MKHICSVGASHLLCAGIGNKIWVTDTNDSHYSFAVFSIDPEEFAKAIEDILHNYEERSLPGEYEEIVLQSSRSCNTLRITLGRNCLAITRGNLKVLYHGYVGALIGLPKAIRKAVKEYERKLEKEYV